VSIDVLVMNTVKGSNLDERKCSMMYMKFDDSELTSLKINTFNLHVKLSENIFVLDLGDAFERSMAGLVPQRRSGERAYAIIFW
jgi:hypothetical protein